MDIEEKMDRNLRGKMILLRKCQVLEEHIRRLEAELEKVEGDAESINTIRNVLAPLYKAAETPRWETKAEEERVQNPLLIENIVECVVKYLDYRTKQSLRAVHSCWNNAVLTPEYLKNTVINIGYLPDSECSGLLEAFPIKDPTVFDFPGSVAIYNLAAIPDSGMLLKWLRVYGKLITSITIYQDDFRARIFEKLLTGLLPNLEHLRIPSYISTQKVFKTTAPTLEKLISLEIDGYYNDTAYALSTDYENVKSILKSAVSLKVLKLGTVPQYLITPLEYLKTCHDAGYLTNLAELHLFKFNLPIGAQFLSEVKFTNLKRLTIPQHITHRDVDSLVGLFKNVTDTLEYLRADAKYLSFLPQMKELKELKCEWTGYWGLGIIPSNYILKLPKLQKITVKSSRASIPDVTDQILKDIFNPYHRNVSIKSLEFINIFVGRSRLFKILGAMQNLNSLTIKRAKIPQNLKSLLESVLKLSKTAEKDLKERRVQINISDCIVVDVEDSEEYESSGEDDDE